MFNSTMLAAPPRSGDPVDLATLGSMSRDAGAITVEWHNPMDVYRLRIFAPTMKAEDVREHLHLKYWGSVWPANGSGGWMKLDDPWNGQWVKCVDPRVQAIGNNIFELTFDELTKEEWEKALEPHQYPGKKVPLYRRTLKVRIESEAVDLSGAALSVFGQSEWREGSFDVQIRGMETEEVASTIVTDNGVVLYLSAIPSGPDVTIDGNHWSAVVSAGQPAGVRLRMLYTDSTYDNAHDRTRVTVRLGDAPTASGFSFVPQDVLRDGIIRLPDFNVIVSESSRNITLANDPGPDSRFWRRPVRTRLLERPEMTRQMAMAGIPRLHPPQWVPLGVPSARQEFFVGPQGDWRIWALSLNTDNGRDAKRWAFAQNFENKRQWETIDFLLDTRETPRFDGGDRTGVTRSLEAGHLPLIHTEWNTGDFHFHHQFLATILLGEYGDDVTRRGDETVVLLSRLDITNKSERTQPANVHLRFTDDPKFSLESSGVVCADRSSSEPGLQCVRVLLDHPDQWAVADFGTGSMLSWRDQIEAGQTRSLYFKTPFVELLDEDELAGLRGMRFEEQTEHVLDYWRQRLARGMQIKTPDEAVNNFYKANLWHNIITTDRDPETGLYNQGVATVRYRVYANETVMIARSMDMRGEHVEAERFIEPMLRYQGTEALKGLFSTAKGAFHGAGQYTQGEYSMNHGFVMWGIADHYFATRDEGYLRRVAAQLVEGCDFLINERRATMATEGERRPYHGFAPACSLEDVVEYQYWFATNGYFYLGLRKAAEALADIEHPDASRIAEQAEAYRRDIEIAMREAATKAAVVPRRDGKWIPYVPSRVYQWKHLTEGWIREALYPALHLATARVVAPDDPLITWMIDDLEDNIFFSWQSGYNVSDYEQTWFERGGVTLQPCLLDMPTVYMARDEPEAALRAFWNSYALLIHPDTTCFAEWAERQGKPGGPLYKTSDECRWLMWLRDLLIWEDDNTLRLGWATPRKWLADGETVRITSAKTRFGEIDFELGSYVDRGTISGSLRIDPHESPPETHLRVRHPDKSLPRQVRWDDKLIPDHLIQRSDIRIPKDWIRPGVASRFEVIYGPR